MDHDCEVLVVGAGPVGLTLGIDLARRGVAVTVIDRRPTADPLTVRCNHVSSRSMETFRRLGLAEAVRAAGFSDDFPHDAAFRTTVTGQEFARIPIPGRAGRRDGAPGPDTWWPTMEPPHRVNQMFLEPVMIDHARATPGLTLRFDTELADFTQDDSGVTATLRGGDGTSSTLRAAFLAGCDGGASGVRKAIGGTLVGDPVVQRVQSSFIHAPGLTARMQAPPAWAYVALNPRRSGTLYTIDEEDRFLVHNYLRPDETDFDAIDRDAAIRTILGVGPDFAYTLLRNEDWIGRRLIADRIRAGRVFLAGDAAHIWVPYAGYGMNAGIADAADLAWLLDAVLKGWGGPGMLDAYSAERLPITEQVSRFAMDHAEKMIRNRGAVPGEIEDDTPEGAAARARFGQLCYDVNVNQYCCAGLNFGYFYDASPIIVPDGATPPAYSMGSFTPSTVPGCRAPHVVMPDGTSLYDHLGPGYTLLRRDGRGGTGLAAAATALGVPLATVDLPPDAGYDAALVLARPDAHVAWRGDGDPSDPAALIARLAGHA